MAMSQTISLISAPTSSSSSSSSSSTAASPCCSCMRSASPEHRLWTTTLESKWSSTTTALFFRSFQLVHSLSWCYSPWSLSLCLLFEPLLTLLTVHFFYFFVVTVISLLLLCICYYCLFFWDFNSSESHWLWLVSKLFLFSENGKCGFRCWCSEKKWYNGHWLSGFSFSDLILLKPDPLYYVWLLRNVRKQKKLKLWTFCLILC
jgi:hypothetical protein